jgi:hypothetical protein
MEISPGRKRAHSDRILCRQRADPVNPHNAAAHVVHNIGRGVEDCRRATCPGSDPEHAEIRPFIS